jgi:thiamine biosynthesis lipoprotein
MGTVIEIVASGLPAEQMEPAVEAAFAEMSRLDALLSRYQPDSEVSRLSQNSAGGAVAPETAEVIALGLDVARRSDGAFDLTLGRVKDLWNFESETSVIPAPELILDALQSTGPEALTLNNLEVAKGHPEATLDLGGIAKGYIVDRAIDVLRTHGVSSAAVNAGGDMYLLGQHRDRPWRIGIQHPREQGQVLATLAVRNRAVVTSGDYERFFELEGQRYHHILDPRTGTPARHCQSVTVIADSVALGDALATAIFVLGPEAGLTFLASYPDAAALVIAADGTPHTSPGWANHLASP